VHEKCTAPISSGFFFSMNEEYETVTIHAGLKAKSQQGPILSFAGRASYMDKDKKAARREPAANGGNSRQGGEKKEKSKIKVTQGHGNAPENHIT